MASGEELEERIAWLEQAVQHLSRYSDPPVRLPPKPGSDPLELSPAAAELARAGNKIEAIRQQSTDTGAGLAEAKAAVDSFTG